MITQNFLDWIRDVIVGWLNTLGTWITDMGIEGAGAAVGSFLGQTGNVLGLFISPGVWPVVLTAWTGWLALWAITGLIAVFARRGTSS